MAAGFVGDPRQKLDVTRLLEVPHVSRLITLLSKVKRGISLRGR